MCVQYPDRLLITFLTTCDLISVVVQTNHQQYSLYLLPAEDKTSTNFSFVSITDLKQQELFTFWGEGEE